MSENFYCSLNLARMWALGLSGSYAVHCTTMSCCLLVPVWTQGSGWGGLGIYGWMSLPFVFHTSSIPHFPFNPPHAPHTPVYPYCCHLSCETYILYLFFTVGKFGLLLGMGREANVAYLEAIWIVSEIDVSEMVWLVSHLFR